MVGSYLDLTIKFHDYSSFFTAFDVDVLYVCFRICFMKNVHLEIGAYVTMFNVYSYVLLQQHLQCITPISVLYIVNGNQYNTSL